MGDLLLARQPAEAAQLSFGPVTLDAPAQTEAWFIVDGQQRVTALAGALLHPDDIPYGNRHAVWFDLETRTFEHLASNSPKVTWLPLNVLADSTRLLRWLDAWPLRRARPELFDVALDLSKAIREYRLPVYLLDGSDEAALRLIFKRVNTAGIGMEEAEVFDALYGRGEERPLHDACQRLTEQGFGTLSPKWFERVVRVVSGVDLRRRGEDQLGTQQVQEAEQAMGRAMTFLRHDAGIPHLATLPYRLPLLLLPHFFHRFPNPSVRERQLLNRWVWRRALAGPQADTSNASLARLRAGISGSASEACEFLLAQVPSESGHINLDIDWNTNAAASRLFALGLWHLHPRTTNGDLVQPSNTAWTKLGALVGSPFHHRATHLAERMLLTAGDKPLTKAVWRTTIAPLAGATREVLDSHAINQAAADALAAGNREAFVFARLPTLSTRLNAVFQANAGFGHSDRPAISTLLERARVALAS